jgi:hypothetical protein
MYVVAGLSRLLDRVSLGGPIRIFRILSVNKYIMYVYTSHIILIGIALPRKKRRGALK